ncbi:efflux RND transporter periplasmic adaptor subunit [Gammaproteobacteria bacterium]|nr:efflux RND transporter periplasmic adaptor subunit [Gammaproteobacteria bacterium]
MSDKKDLLNNLKIDRTAPPSGESMAPLTRYSILGAISVAIVFGWLFFASEDPVEVTTFTVKEINQNDTSISSILDASGYVTARRQATVSSKITGKVLKVFIEEGDVVKEGQLLAQLDDSTYVAEMNYAEAQFKEAKRVFDRTYELIEGQLASQASLDAARASMDSLEALYTVRKQFVSDMQVRAPFGGVVVYKAAQPGEMVSPVSAGGGFTRSGICTIVDMDSLEVEVDVNEAFINRVIAGQPAVANLNAYPKWDIPAKVIAIIPTADRNKATVKVRIGFLEKDERVLPDMGARVSFLRKVEKVEKQAIKEGVMVPLNSVGEIDNTSYVLIVVNGKLKLSEVVVAEETNNYARVISGLATGSKVVARFDYELEDNQKVIIN